MSRLQADKKRNKENFVVFDNFLRRWEEGITTNVPVVYMARDVMILMGQKSISRAPPPSNGPRNGYCQYQNH